MKASAYQNPAGPRTLTVTKRGRREAPEQELPAVVAVSSRTECHVTPSKVADYMADCLEICASDSILEPHAGTGNLLQAVFDAGAIIEQVLAVEINSQLLEATRQRFPELVSYQTDFLEWAKTARKFNKIIMNPPFSNYKQHIKAAVGLLEVGGVLVALVPASFNAEGFEVLDELNADTFAAAKVRTKIVKFEVQP